MLANHLSKIEAQNFGLGVRSLSIELHPYQLSDTKVHYEKI